jgi:hypothetical protein
MTGSPQAHYTPGSIRRHRLLSGTEEGTEEKQRLFGCTCQLEVLRLQMSHSSINAFPVLIREYYGAIRRSHAFSYLGV